MLCLGFPRGDPSERSLPRSATAQVDPWTTIRASDGRAIEWDQGGAACLRRVLLGHVRPMLWPGGENVWLKNRKCEKFQKLLFLQ